MTQLVLASSSPYRKALLERLGLSFQTLSPQLDETAADNESAQQLVARLAEAKARAVASTFPTALIIGSDQVAVLNEKILGKPGDYANAKRQLQEASGRRVTFHTGLCVYNAAQDRAQVDVVPYSVLFRNLSDAEIDCYLQKEQPYDCAGSFKSEGLGIALFESMQGDDPNALIGLPLISLCSMLADNGLHILHCQSTT